MTLRSLAAITALSMSAGLAQVPLRKANSSDSCDAVVSSLAEQADLASSVALPNVFVPSVLLGIGSALDGCSFESAKSFMLRAFDGARASSDGAVASGGTDGKRPTGEDLESAIQSSRRATLVSVISWLVDSAEKRKRPELVGVARELAGQIAYRENVIGRQEAFGPVLNALLQKHDNDAVQELLSEIEAADGASPTAMLLAVLESGGSDELKTSVLRRGYAAVEAGQCGLPADLRFIQKLSEVRGRTQAAKVLRDCLSQRKNIKSPTREDEVATKAAVDLLLRLAPELASEYPASTTKPPPPAVNSPDDLSRMYEDIQALAEDSSAAVALRVAQIQDPQTRQALLTSAQSTLVAAGKMDAAARVAAVIASMPLTDNSDQHPLELLLRARSTTTGDGLRAQVSHALAMAEKLLSAENKEYAAAPNERDRIRLYSQFKDEAVVTFLYAAENAFDLAFESAQRVIGPRRAEVITMLLTAVCEKHTDKGTGVATSR